MAHPNALQAAAGLEDFTHYKLRCLMRLVSKRCDEHLAPAGIKGTQLSLLLYLSSAEPSTLSCTAAAMGMDISTLSRNLAVLVQQGWVQVDPGEDGRTRRARLTEAGCAKRAEALPALISAQHDLDERIGMRCVAGLNQVLDRAISCLSTAVDAQGLQP